MKKERRIPTIIAFLLLILGMTGGVILIETGVKWFVGAKPEISPGQVKITNITESSFTVSWITEEETTGAVQYGEGKEISFTALDDRDQLSSQQDKFWTHHVTIKNLKPETEYFFKINSGGRLFDDDGRLYKVKTAPIIQEAAPASDVAYGTVLKADGTPAGGVIVYLSLANAAPLSALTRTSGTWAIPLNIARAVDLISWASYDKEASVEEIFVQGGKEGTAVAVTLTKNDSPVPEIILGQNFDFRQAPLSPTPTPVGDFSTSRFSAQPLPTPYPTLQIFNPSEGEEINTSTPEIFGVGPPGKQLDITVESPETLRGQITVGEDGSWRWVSPQPLSPGVHKVTVRLSDGQQITRSFTVLAAEGGELPSFTASPSGTLTPLPTSLPTLSPTSTFTPTPTVTPIARAFLPSTEGGIPQPGNLTPSFLLSILGLILVVCGILFK